MDRVVVVGASTAGLTAVETLRSEGFEGSLLLVGDEGHPPYGRPPLSKQILLGAWTPDQTMLSSESDLDRLGVDRRLGTAAVGLDLDHRRVALSDGSVVSYDGLVVATGVSPRRLPQGHDLMGVHVLRTLDDALTLRSGLLERPTVVIVGAGFVGTEVAAAARQMDLDVTLIDSLPLPMLRQVGARVGREVAELHTRHGVRLILGAGVATLEGSAGRVVGVRLTGGRLLSADLVLVAIGSTPNTEWVRSAGLSVGNGLDCDELCRAGPGVVAAGDVASWTHASLRRRVRVEHRLNASEQAVAAARVLLGHNRPFAPVPYFWSDQYDVRIQSYGFLDADAKVEIVAGHPGSKEFAAVYSRGRRVIGALAWNMPLQARRLRQVVFDAYQVRADDAERGQRAS